LREKKNTRSRKSENRTKIKQKSRKIIKKKKKKNKKKRKWSMAWTQVSWNLQLTDMARARDFTKTLKEY
jgi:hypothetical protein